jgi:hypothetical protein
MLENNTKTVIIIIISVLFIDSSVVFKLLFFSSVQAIGLVPWVRDWIFSGHQCIKDSLSKGYSNSPSMVISLFFVFTLWIICHCCCLQWQFDMELASISNKWDGNPIPSYLTDFWQEKKGWLFGYIIILTWLWWSFSWNFNFKKMYNGQEAWKIQIQMLFVSSCIIILYENS